GDLHRGGARRMRPDLMEPRRRAERAAAASHRAETAGRRAPNVVKCRQNEYVARVQNTGAFPTPRTTSVRLGQLSFALEGRGRYLLQLAALTAAYAISGRLGLHLAFASRSVSAIWPPTGIALAALVIGGFRLWPAVALGALLTNVDTGVPAVTVAG